MKYFATLVAFTATLYTLAVAMPLQRPQEICILACYPERPDCGFGPDWHSSGDAPCYTCCRGESDGGDDDGGDDDDNGDNDRKLMM